MKNIILLFVMLVFCVEAQAQVFGAAPVNTAPENDVFANLHQKWTPMMQKLFQQVKNDDEYITHYVGAEVGSPYETEDFNKGKVYYDNEFLGDFYYRYNAFSNEIEVKKTLLEEEKHKALIPDSKVLLIDEKGRKMRVHTFENSKGDTEEGYLKLLFKGADYKLYRRLRVKFTEAKAAENSMVNPTPSRFTDFVEYYYNQEKGQINSVPLKKGKFFKSFSASKNGELKDFIKKEQLELNNERHLVQIFQFMDNR